MKETNRIDTTADMLGLLGFDIQPTADGLIIHPSSLTRAAVVDSLSDHRIGMMLAIDHYFHQNHLKLNSSML